MKRLRYLLLFLLPAFTPAKAQQFWLTTYEFPGGPKTAIALQGDSTLYTSTAAGVMRSYNQGKHFDTTALRYGNIYSLYLHGNILLAGAPGKIYRSANNGTSWDSATLNTTYPVVKMQANAPGHLFAITGCIDTLGYVGAGVYFSADNGATWVQRNTGLGNLLSCDGLVIDKNGRVYITVRDELATGNGGLFYTDDEGQHWQHVNITVNAANAINNDLQVIYATGLSISPADSLYFSFEGMAVNTLVTLNVCKHINQVTSSNFWQVIKVGNPASWWLDIKLNDIHFAQNGDWYSSFSNSYTRGGTFFRKAGTVQWQRHTEGLGGTIFSDFGPQQIVETGSGKIFMVQMLDERIYQIDTSVLTAIDDDNNVTIMPAVTLYPNPVPPATTLTLQWQQLTTATYTIYNLAGQAIANYQGTGTRVTLPAPTVAGMYLISIQHAGGTQALRLLVGQ